MEVQWYPGHMAKSKHQMEQSIRLVDLVVETVDARAPKSSRNPDLDELWKRKPRIVVLNKADLADQEATAAWVSYYQQQGAKCLSVNAASGKGVKEIVRTAEAMVEEIRPESKKGRAIKMMVTGIPNVGKSTLVNRLCGRSQAARTGDKPGVTKSEQWVRVSSNLMLLDTPGILWPKFEDPETGVHLALIGCIGEQAVDTETLAVELLERMKKSYGSRLMERYRLKEEDLQKTGYELLVQIARNRGHLLGGGRVDTGRTARMLMDEFRQGKLGRMTLEEAPCESQ